MSKKNNIGIKTLFEVAGIEEYPKVFHAGFILGPRINAGGRVGQSYLGSKLLITNDESEAKDISYKLNDFNEQRKNIENNVLEEAKLMASAQNDSNILVLHNKNWHTGVIGIVASRIVEHYNKPAIIISENGENSKGSGRSVYGIDIGKIITLAKQNANVILTKENMYDLEFVNSGDDASRVLIDLITNKINSGQRKQIELDLLKYAEKDTLNLVDLYKHLKSVSEFM